MMSFMNVFNNEVKEIFLFLNYVKKIIFFEIKGDQLKEIYLVVVYLIDEDDVKCVKFFNYIKSFKVLKINEIDWFGIMYLLFVEDMVCEEKWFIY